MIRTPGTVCACNGFAVYSDGWQCAIVVEHANGSVTPLSYITIGCRNPALLIERTITEYLFNRLPALDLEPVKGVKEKDRKPIEERNARKVRAQWDREHDRTIEGSAADTAVAVANAFVEATCETPSSTR